MKVGGVACGSASASRLEEALGQEAGVLGEQAEEELVEEVGDRLRVVAAVAQAIGERRRTGAAASSVSSSRVLLGPERLGVAA